MQYTMRSKFALHLCRNAALVFGYGSRQYYRALKLWLKAEEALESYCRVEITGNMNSDRLVAMSGTRAECEKFVNEYAARMANKGYESYTMGASFTGLINTQYRSQVNLFIKPN